MDPVTILSVALLGGVVVGGQHEATAPFYGCEVVEIEGTNVYQYADPTCPPFNGGGSSQAGHDGSANVPSGVGLVADITPRGDCASGCTIPEDYERPVIGTN
jgi:hypothetical protein